MKTTAQIMAEVGDAIGPRRFKAWVEYVGIDAIDDWCQWLNRQPDYLQDTARNYPFGIMFRGPKGETLYLMGYCIMRNKKDGREEMGVFVTNFDPMENYERAVANQYGVPLSYVEDIDDDSSNATGPRGDAPPEAPGRVEDRQGQPGGHPGEPPAQAGEEAVRRDTPPQADAAGPV